MTDEEGTASKSMSLSVRLLREGRSIDESLRDGHGLEERPSETGRLFVDQAPAVPPTWFKFVREFAVGEFRPLVNQSCAAVLFLDVPPEDKRKATRTVALTFGTAYHSLDPDAFERSFGLKVVLNAVARSNLRSLDIATLDATTFQKRIQASRDADLRGFGIDVDRDLLRLAAGSPRDNSFARSLAGKDALVLHTKTSPADVIEKCKTALKLYHATDYREDFGFIDFVTPIRRQDLIEQLDAAVFAELQELVKGNASDLHITLPDILSPEESVEVGYFGIGLKSGRKQAYGQIAIEDYVEELKAGQIAEIADMAELRASHEIRVIADGQGDKRQKRKLYDCFVYELTHKGDTYVLFSGDWCAVDKTFHTAVENDLLKLVAKKPFVASTSTQNEREFIAELDAHKNLLNLDQVKLSPAGALGANLEPCDFLSTARQFIHLKDGHSSAPISHLWNQGVVSAESFVRDEQFRIELRKEVKKRQAKSKKAGFDVILPDGRSKPVPSEFTVVFGIMRDRYKKSGTVSLPFFSKVSLRAIAGRIELMGFPVEVHLVERN
ncbi:TIGR04141 family sporadically distributed protein [Bradyrhizobium sp. Pear77]|uniref:DUF6119 family protein n=1 Tax=Bradyrhizobium altum TaxID=1571202 RepID=UPI001E2B1387|nr:DUF6119 family protein [Bradyrhizobium altum]MCC8957830.1 TIGR04141 family sporadically distributed protein [Bradyrhizobium altum]